MTRILIEASLGKFLTEKIDKTHEWRNDHKYKWFDGAHRWLTVLADKFHPPQIPPAQFFSSKRFFFFWFYSCARSCWCDDCRQQRWSEDMRRPALADVEVEGENYCWWKGGGGGAGLGRRERQKCVLCGGRWTIAAWLAELRSRYFLFQLTQQPIADGIRG